MYSKELFPLFHDSSSDEGRGSNSPKPSRELERWKHLSSHKRMDKSDSLPRHRPLKKLYSPKRFIFQAPVNRTLHENMNRGTTKLQGRASTSCFRHPPQHQALAHAISTLSIYVYVQLSSAVKRGSWQSMAEILPLTPVINDQFHRIAQTCPTTQKETSDSRFFSRSALVKIQ